MSQITLAKEGLPQFLSDYSFADEYRIPIMTKAPTMDGFVDEEEWKCAAGFDGFSHEARLEDRSVRGYVGATKTHFYFAIISEMPVGGELCAAQKTHSTNVVFDDSVEVWVAPQPDGETGVTYQMLANSIGYDAYQCHVLGDVPREQWYGWEGHYKIAHGFHEGFWHCEIEVPVEIVAKGRLATDGVWGINLTRNFKQPWAFANLGNSSYSPVCNLFFTFVEDGGLAVQVKHKSDIITRKIDAEMSVYNPGTKTLDVSAHLFLKRDLMPEWQEDADLSVAPGETKSISLKLDEAVSNKFNLFAVVREDGGKFYYTRHYAWGPPREVRWETQKREVLPVDFTFAYYPYFNKMKISADIKNLDESAKLEAIDFEIRPKDGGEAVKTVTIKASDFSGTSHEIEFDMPKLDGVYDVVATSRGTGVPEEPVVKMLERYVFDWEHKNLGKSRKVYAPFTPIKVEGSTLHTAMKEYDLNALGLFDGVRTLDQQQIALKDVLAGPMAYTAVIGGKVAPVDGASVRIVDAADDVVVAESTATAGGLKLSTKSTLEYDGMMRVDLTLSADQPTQVDSLELRIPFNGEVAKMIHAMTDGLRYPIITASLPAEGQGVIWSASDLLALELPKNFCTYILLGDALRGLCWFAENDAGWSWDHEKPNLEVERASDGTIVMKIHLVNKPVSIDSPRTITFGLQGAPIKPKLEGSRHKWYTDNYSILGCDRHWYALGICGSVYPAGRDMKLWEAIKKANKVAFTDQEIADFIAYGRKYFEPYGWETHTEEFVELASKNLKNRVGTTMIFYYNRASSPVYDEYQTFADEWGMSKFNWRGERPPYEVKITPTESYIDYALYWYGKSFEVAGNTGVYIDNNYFCATRNTEMTAAYETDHEIMPATGIWGLRELAKRTFIYMNELGMLPINMNHMSTVQILPINAFYTVQYDWEWKFSEGDAQDRFSYEYLTLVTNGDHAGVWPIVLHDNGRRKFEPWNMRTFHGVCAVNDLIIDRYFWHMEPVPEGDNEENRLYYKLRVPISEIVQQPDCQVYRYWDDRPQPVKATNPDLRTIIFSRPGKEAIVEITSYAQDDADAVLNIDAAALGLSSGYTTTDMETGEEVKVENNTIKFPLKRHDLRQFRLVAK